MSLLTPPLHVSPPPLPPGDDPAPLVYVAGHGHRIELRLAAVIEEFGLRTHVGAAGSPLALDAAATEALDEAAVLLCHVVRPSELPVEVALAAVRGLPVVAIVPHGVALDGLAGEVLAEAGARIVRYAGSEPHRLLHGGLARAIAQYA